LAALRAEVMNRMTPKRFRHTVAVEEMTVRLCALFCPAETNTMRAAALLHDVTKELSDAEQIALCERFGLSVTEDDRAAPKTFHARTAEALIAAEFPAFADSTVLSAVRWHTTGRRGMTLCERLLYLADYIDDSRTFPSCVLLRRYFWGAEPQKMEERARLALLRDTLLLSFDLTIKDLLDEGRPIAADTTEARNFLLAEARMAD
jgi:nicotinate-nucleotide adenylyltransferase